MGDKDFLHPKAGSGRSVRRVPGPWLSQPLEGRFGLVYEDAAGVRSRRILEARELRLGPGRTLLCGIDVRRGCFRGFRVDRIARIVDLETGTRAEAGILDHLLARAEAQRRTLRAPAQPSGTQRPATRRLPAAA